LMLVLFWCWCRWTKCKVHGGADDVDGCWHRLVLLLFCCWCRCLSCRFLTLMELKLMMEDLDAPQTHMALKAGDSPLNNQLLVGRRPTRLPTPAVSRLHPRRLCRIVLF
jgi:hypothetical protein